MTALPEGYEPLSDADVDDIRRLVAPEDSHDWDQYRLAAQDLLNERDYWKQRAEAAEAKVTLRCPEIEHYHCAMHPEPLFCYGFFRDDMGGLRCSHQGNRAESCHE